MPGLYIQADAKVVRCRKEKKKIEVRKHRVRTILGDISMYFFDIKEQILRT